MSYAPSFAEIVDLKYFLRGCLGAARTLSNTPEITVTFSNTRHLMAIPPQDSLKVVLPKHIDLRSPLLYPQLRMRFDMAAAWAARNDDNIFLPEASDEGGLARHFKLHPLNKYFVHIHAFLKSHDAARTLLLALEKARRESLFIAEHGHEWPALKHNIIRTLPLDLHTRVKRNLNLMYVFNSEEKPQYVRDEDMMIAEGLYLAALYAMNPDIADLRPDIAQLGRMWLETIQISTGIKLKNLFAHMHDAEAYIKMATSIAGTIDNRDILSKPLRLEHIQTFVEGDRKKIRKYEGLSILELQQTLLAGQPLKRYVENPNSEEAAYIPVREFNMRKDQKRRDSKKQWRRMSLANLQPDHQVISKGGDGKANSAVDVFECEDLETHKIGTGKEPEKTEEPPLFALEDLAEELLKTNGRRKHNQRTPKTDLKHEERIIPASDKLGLDIRRGAFMQSYFKHRKEHEVITEARTLDTKQSLTARWAALNKAYPGALSEQRTLLKKLEKWLQAMSGTRVVHDSEEGLLDPSRLTSLITNPTESHIYLGTTPALIRDTVVTLLCDHSGSMNGERLAIACLLAEGLTRVLEKARIPNEVLGFTTTRIDSVYKSNHIVMKAFNERVANTRHHFGLAHNPMHLGGTNDTDAILWALYRLSQRPEKRKILVVISDVDPNTSFIKQDFPDLDYIPLLRSVIKYVAPNMGIEVIGIGTQPYTAVNEFYPNGVALQNFKDLGPVLIRKLQEVLDPAYASQRLAALRYRT